MTEREAVRLLDWNGMPLSCHVMLTAGPRATFGLLSPSDRRIERGDRFTTAFGVWGALDCRAGFVVEDATELPHGIGDYVDRLVGPYFEADRRVVRGPPHRPDRRGAARDHRAPARRPVLRHLPQSRPPLGLDEWVNSPIFAGSTIELRSGMALQVDIIPATGTDYFTTNIEDGIALADASLRGGVRGRYPEPGHGSRPADEFMADALGIELHPDVLPFSNIPAFLPPFLLRPDTVMTLAD